MMREGTYVFFGVFVHGIIMQSKIIQVSVFREKKYLECSVLCSWVSPSQETARKEPDKQTRRGPHVTGSRSQVASSPPAPSPVPLHIVLFPSAIFGSSAFQLSACYNIGWQLFIPTRWTEDSRWATFSSDASQHSLLKPQIGCWPTPAEYE